MTISKLWPSPDTTTISVFKRYNMVDEAELRSLIFSLDTSVDTKGNLDKQKEVSTNV